MNTLKSRKTEWVRLIHLEIPTTFEIQQQQQQQKASYLPLWLFSVKFTYVIVTVFGEEKYLLRFVEASF